MVDNNLKRVVCDHYMVVKKDSKRVECVCVCVCVCVWGGGAYIAVDQQEISAPVVCVPHTEL